MEKSTSAKLSQHKVDLGFWSKVDEYGKFTSNYSEDISFEDYLKIKQVLLLKTIKNCLLFFTTLTILGIIAYFLIFLFT